jgi:hypothetical protein
MQTSPIDPNQYGERMTFVAFSFVTAATFVAGSFVLYGVAYLAG